MQNENKCHSRVGRQRFKELLERFESAGGRANTHDSAGFRAVFLDWQRLLFSCRGMHDCFFHRRKHEQGTGAQGYLLRISKETSIFTSSSS
jgi:hypothetical protein